MSFAEAVKQAFSKYATFRGRARRSEYWFFVLFNVIVTIVASIADGILETSVFSVLVALALLLPGLAVSVRRLHDISRSGWWLLIALVPVVGFILLIVWYCQDSHGPNQHGPSPKQAPMQEPGYQSTL